MKEIITDMEDLFRKLGNSKAKAMPKIKMDFEKQEFEGMNGWYVGMAGYSISENNKPLVGIKWLSRFNTNSRIQLPTLNSLIIINDPETGLPLAVADGNLINIVSRLIKNNPENYIKEVCLPALKKANEEGLVDAVDGFCETVALNVEQLKEVFELAQKLNLPIKLHAEQLSHSGGVKLATSYDAISIDHLEYANEEDTKLMSKSGSVAVILPGAYYTLNETQKPPIELFRKYKVPMAIATDCNPGSSPLTSILLAMNMASTLFKITPLEALSGVTKHAADALSLKDLGQIKPGMIADLAIWNLEHPSEFSYRIGFNGLYKRIFGGSI